ncbi:MAG: YihA family ribosome biogenesis GTP-binding protein [Clostridia bacterium]|nr:YihA family ribosome biogenesis GTP-binding protein [Clostridia bacterium]
MPKDDLPQIAFSGRSNVGKSSLLNAIFQRKNFARTSSQPGKTVTINFYCVDNSFYLVDLPGYGYAKRTQQQKRQWSDLVEGYLSGENKNLCGIVQLIDMKVGATEDDDMMLRWLFDTSTPYFVVATKADKLNKTEFEKQKKMLTDYDMIIENTPVIPFSNIKSIGRDETVKQILKLLKN